MAAMLFGFWFLFQTSAAWVSVAFYLMALLLGVLLISQFWTLANLVYDPRQAKRLFGFIGGGAPLGGIAARRSCKSYTTQIGTTNMLLISGTLMLRLRGAGGDDPRSASGRRPARSLAVKEEKGVSAARGVRRCCASRSTCRSSRSSSALPPSARRSSSSS